MHLRIGLTLKALRQHCHLDRNTLVATCRGSSRTRPLTTRGLQFGSVPSWRATSAPPPSANGSACWRRAEHVCLVRQPSIYLALGATDLRQGLEGLYALVEQRVATMDRGQFGARGQEVFRGAAGAGGD